MVKQGLLLCKRHWIACLVVLTCIVGLYGSYHRLPPEIGMTGETYSLSDSSVMFLNDETYIDSTGERVAKQQIFDEVMKMIDGARSYILIDMFLWNPFQGASPQEFRLLSQELTDALITKKHASPEMLITVVSDPINTVYEGQPSYQFEALEVAGIPVVITDHSELRDSNPLYSSIWRSLLQWPDLLHVTILEQPYTFRWAPNVMDADGEQITLRSYLKLMNFKANHRKLIVADETEGDKMHMVTLVTSANPHDGSSMHSNVALRVEGGIWRDAVRSEQAVGHFSGISIPDVSISDRVVDSSGEVEVTLLTEYAIQERAIDMIGRAQKGDSIELAIFYLSVDGIVDALIDASTRGASVRVILDPNKDAFGMEKNGIPNRPVAAKLIHESSGMIELRWCATHGEQCHSKMLLVSAPDYFALMLGSANYTRRNLNNLNLETNVHVASKIESTAFRDARAYFERMWSNPDGKLYTLEYDAYKDESRSKRVLSWLMEHTGLSTF